MSAGRPMALDIHCEDDVLDWHVWVLRADADGVVTFEEAVTGLEIARRAMPRYGRLIRTARHIRTCLGSATGIDSGKASRTFRELRAIGSNVVPFQDAEPQDAA